jgi:spore coat protein U-like protein
MKTRQAWRILAVAAAALGCSGAFADSMNMTVQANVVGTCRMVSTPSIDFGALNQVTAPVVTPAGPFAITYRCTKNTSSTTITLGGSASPFTGSLTNGTDNIAYTITWTNPSGAAAVGSGLGSTITPISVTLAASMPGGANYQNVSAGSYSQTVSVAVNP